MICRSEVRACERDSGFTLEDGADMFPDGYAATAVELPECQLHVEQGNPAKYRHQQVGEQERTWKDSLSV